MILISADFLQRQFPGLPRRSADTARDLLRKLAHPYYTWPSSWREIRGEHLRYHYTHLLRPIFEQDIAPLLPDLLDEGDTAFEADGCVFEHRSGELLDCRPVVNTGDTYVPTVWLLFGRGAYWTCLGDLVERMERNGWSAAESNDVYLKL